jgi:hypothetical protein
MVVAGRLGIVTRWPLEVNRSPPIRRPTEQLEIREWPSGRDFVQKTARATMKSGVSTNFSLVRESGVMLKRNHSECICLERPPRCAR